MPIYILRLDLYTKQYFLKKKKKDSSFPGINMVVLHKQMLELHKYEPKIEKEIFIQLTEAFRVNKLKG
jgi:hypothetical protein